MATHGKLPQYWQQSLAHVINVGRLQILQKNPLSKAIYECLTALAARHSFITAYYSAAHHQGLADKCGRNTDSCILYAGNLLTNLCGDACEYVEQRTVFVLVHQCPIIFAVLPLVAL